MGQGTSYYAAKAALLHALENNLYLGLVLAPATPDMDGTNIIEPTPLEYPNYARVHLPPSVWTTPSVVPTTDQNGNPVSSTISSNNVLIMFPTPLNTSLSMVVMGWALLDSSTNGNLIYFSTSTPTLIASQVTPYFDPHTLVIGIS